MGKPNPTRDEPGQDENLNTERGKIIGRTVKHLEGKENSQPSLNQSRREPTTPSKRLEKSRTCRTPSIATHQSVCTLDETHRCTWQSRQLRRRNPRRPNLPHSLKASPPATRPIKVSEAHRFTSRRGHGLRLRLRRTGWLWSCRCSDGLCEHERRGTGRHWHSNQGPRDASRCAERSDNALVGP